MTGATPRDTADVPLVSGASFPVGFAATLADELIIAFGAGFAPFAIAGVAGLRLVSCFATTFGAAFALALLVTLPPDLGAGFFATLVTFLATGFFAAAPDVFPDFGAGFLAALVLAADFTAGFFATGFAFLGGVLLFDFAVAKSLLPQLQPDRGK